MLHRTLLCPSYRIGLDQLSLDLLVLPPEDQQMSPLKQFGFNLRNARQAKGWTQEELAREAGIPAPQVSRIERGVRDVRLTTLLRVLSALECKPEELLADLY